MTKRTYEYAGDEEQLGEYGLLIGDHGELLRIRDAGTLIKICGVLVQGMGRSEILLYPSAYDLDYDITVGVRLNLEQWTAFLKRSDDPLIFQEDETGTIKSVVRKAQYAISGAVQQQIWVRDDCRCMFCGKKMGDVQLTIDHFVPLQKGGANNQSNYLSACRLCQKRKGSMDPEKYCAEQDLDYEGLVKYLAGKMPAFLISHLQE
jgi:hypothetical protein